MPIPLIIFIVLASAVHFLAWHYQIKAQRMLERSSHCDDYFLFIKYDKLEKAAFEIRLDSALVIGLVSMVWWFFK